MKNIIKNNIIGFTIGAIVFSSIVGVLASSIPSNSVAYENNITVADAIDDLYEKGIEKPSVYWFSSTQYAIGNVPTALYLSGTSTGHIVYIGSTSKKHYACATIQGHEVCFSQPYTQYGLEGHTLNSSFTTTQQTSAKNAILQVFNDAGINIDISSCGAGTGNAYCYFGDMYCYVYSSGSIFCRDDSLLERCYVGASGDAYCYD